jgi:hypothetical protein
MCCLCCCCCPAVPGANGLLTKLSFRAELPSSPTAESQEWNSLLATFSLLGLLDPPPGGTPAAVLALLGARCTGLKTVVSSKSGKRQFLVRFFSGLTGCVFPAFRAQSTGSLAARCCRCCSGSCGSSSTKLLHHGSCTSSCADMPFHHLLTFLQQAEGCAFPAPVLGLRGLGTCAAGGGKEAPVVLSAGLGSRSHTSETLGSGIMPPCVPSEGGTSSSLAACPDEALVAALTDCVPTSCRSFVDKALIALSSWSWSLVKALIAASPSPHLCSAAA